MNSNLKSDIKRAIDLARAIKRKIKMKDYKDWYQTELKKREKGTSESQVNGVLSELNELYDSEELNSHEEDRAIRGIRIMNSFFTCANKFNIDQGQRALILSDLETNRSISSIKEELVFLAYFFFENKDIKEPALARAILVVRGTNSIEFQNIPTGDSISYKTGFLKYRKDNKVAIIGLTSASGDVSVHIKVFCKNIEDPKEIFIGSYLTYKQKSIVRGSIVLVRRKGNINVKPALLSIYSNPEQYRKVPIAIQRFLSKRVYNHRRVPSDIRSISDLENFVKKNVNGKPSKRFIESMKPRIYISSPNSSIDNEDEFKGKYELLSELKQKIESSIKHDIEVAFQATKYNDVEQSTKKPPSLEFLKFTSTFVLIYSHSSVASFCLIQLGIAIQICKHCIVYYEAGSLSDNILRLGNVGVTLIPIPKGGLLNNPDWLFLSLKTNITNTFSI